MATTGKNEPCPCGSGKTYEDRCLSGDVLNAGRMDARSFSQAVLSMMENRKFSSLGEAQAELDHLTRARNTTPLHEFCGLSPEQMYRFLYYPFESSGLVHFNLDLKQFPDSPFFRLFSFLLNGVAKEELKATTQGNLPVKFVDAAALLHYGEHGYHERRRYMSLRTETDLPVLHTVRVVAEMSGFIRKYKSRFRLTKAGTAVVEQGMNGNAFLTIFRAYTRKFNWAYNDRYPDLHIVQEAFLFTLYALVKFGDIFRPVSFYEDLFLSAFPKETRDVPDVSFDTRENTLKRCFSLRSLSRFAHFFGFAEHNDPQNARRLEKLSVKKAPLLDDWVQFHVK